MKVWSLPLKMGCQAPSQVLTVLSIPSLASPSVSPTPELEPGTEMGVMIPQGMFGKDDGQIQWYGIIATINMSRESWAQEGMGRP